MKKKKTIGLLYMVLCFSLLLRFDAFSQNTMYFGGIGSGYDSDVTNKELLSDIASTTSEELSIFNGGDGDGYDNSITEVSVISNFIQPYNEIACDSFIYNGVVYTESGHYTQTVGCITVSFDLTVYQSGNYEITEESCGAYVWNDETYTESGTYFQVFSNQNGCDSIVTFHLTVNEVTYHEEGFLICSNHLPYEWNGILCDTTGLYQKTFTTVEGCDSILVLNLTVENASSSQTQLQICSNELPFSWNDMICDSSGIYQTTLTATNGCDSIVVLHLDVISPPLSIEVAIVVCETELPFLWNGLVCETAGIYSATLHSSEGCDSTVALNLIVVPFQPTVNNVIVCEGTIASLVASGGNSYKWSNGQFTPFITVQPISSSVYTVTIYGANGCSAVKTATIEVFPAPVVEIQVTNSYCGLQNGSAIAIASGGLAPYQYVWTNGDRTDIADSLSSGTYMLELTDANNCKSMHMVSINDENGPTVLLDNVNHIPCHGMSTLGAINISVSGGVSPYSYEWSNGATTQNLFGLLSGQYDVFVTDQAGCGASLSVVVEQPQQITVIADVTSAGCGINDGEISVNVSGGTPPYNYNWNNGDSTDVVSNLEAGVYFLVVSDAVGCNSYPSVFSLSNNNAPVITIDSLIQPNCNGVTGAIYTSVTGGVEPYQFSWNDGSSSEFLTISTDGQYIVTVTDDVGCIAILPVQVAEVSPDKPEICIVTVDNHTGKNLIVWEKSQNDGISHYNIYKETTISNVFLKIDSVMYDSLSIYVDYNSNPRIRSYRYRISAVDLCGNESLISDVHKTVHLTINQGLGQSINLIWDKYEGFSFGTFYIHRHLHSTGWLTIDSLPANLTSYTDFPPNNGGLFYKISLARMDSECLPNKSLDYSGPYLSSFSNIDTSQAILVGLSNSDMVRNTCRIYPNPFSINANIEFNMGDAGEIELSIYDITGRLVYANQMNLDAGNHMFVIGKHTGMVSAGAYIITVKANDFVFSTKMLKY